MPADLHVQTGHQLRRIERFVDQRPQHREQQRHQQRSRTPLPRDVAQRDYHAAVGKRQHVVEVTADGIGRPRHSADFDVGGPIGARRQHRELNLARNFELAFQRQPVGHFQEDQKVEQQQADDQRKRAVGPDRHQNGDADEGEADRDIDGPEPPKQLHHAGKRDDQRGEIQNAPRRRKLERERNEHLAHALQTAAPPRQPAQRVFVVPAREESIGVARIMREQALKVLGRQIARVQTVNLTNALRSPNFHQPSTPNSQLPTPKFLPVRRFTAVLGVRGW